jgi:F-type H+-transporting ATPase subunit gamma
MAAQIRVLRRRIRSTQSIKKITRAMELIATSRIVKARARVLESRPYAEQITAVLTELASNSALDHPLLLVKEPARRAAVLVVTSDRGKEPVIYVVGRKGVNYYRFRKREVKASWTGFSEQPTYADAAEAARTLVEAFMADDDDENSVDELHLVYTQFKNMVTQTPQARRMAPMVVEYVEDEPSGGIQPLYEFEPDADALFDALLPKYIGARLFSALLESAASESANRQRAMKAATDNANELIRNLTLESNQARQAQITQEISEIVGGADALVTTGSD